MQTDPFAVLSDPTLAAILRRHHARSNRQLPRLWMSLLPELPRLLLGLPADMSRASAVESRLYLAIQPEQGAFCYLTALALRAEQIVEFGTSFGVSTLWLAAALRTLGRGQVIATEILPEKAARARAHLEEADLAGWVDLRVGDARETLRELPTVDLLLNDGSPVHALEILQIVAPKMRPGAVVITDNVGTMPANYRGYLAWLDEPSNGFRSMTVPYKLGTQLSVRL